MAVMAAIFLLLLIVLYFRVAGTAAVNSDHASIVLEADAVRHGNILLRGWTLTNVSFRATDLPFYIAALDCGVSEAEAMRVVPAVIYALTVLFAVWLTGRGRDRSRAWLGMVIAFVLIGLPSVQLPEVVLVGVDHVGTTLLMILALLALDFAPKDRIGWRQNILCGVCCVLLLISDQIAVLTLVLPLSLVTIARSRKAQGAERIREAIPLGMILASMAAAQIIQIALRHTGGGETVPLDMVFVSLTDLPLNILAAIHSVLTLFRADFFGSHVGLACAGRIVGLLGVGLVFYTLGRALLAWRDWNGGGDRIAQVLGLGMALNLAAFVFNNASTTMMNTINSPPERYLVPFFLFGAILAGRLGAELIRDKSLLRYGTGLVGLVYFALFVHQLGLPDADIPATRLAQWLAANNLHDGYGNFWCSSIVTVESEGAVRVRPVVSTGGPVTRLHWFSSASWYDQPSHFLIYDVTHSPMGDFYWCYVNDKTAYQTFGAPSEIAKVGPYTVLLWNKNIAPALK